MGLFDDIFGGLVTDITDINGELTSLKDDIAASVTDLGQGATSLHDEVTNHIDSLAEESDQVLGGE